MADLEDLPDLPPAVLRCDIHTHLLPLRLATKIRAFFEQHGLVCCPPPVGTSESRSKVADDDDAAVAKLIYPTDSTRTIAQLFRELAPSTRGSKGKARAATSGPYDPFRPLQLITLPYAHTGNMSRQLNSDVARLAEWLTRDELWNARLRVLPGFTVHPDDSDPVAVVEEALGGGARVMKLHCSVGKLSITDERLDGVWKLAEETGFATVVHFGTSFFGTTEEEDLRPGLAEFIKRWPKAKIIVGALVFALLHHHFRLRSVPAHLGHPSIDLALSFASHPNIYYDLTPVVTSPVLPSLESSSDPALASTILDLALSGRILFGSDVPNVAIPVSSSLRLCQRYFYSASRLRSNGKGDWKDVAQKALEEVLGDAAERLVDEVQAQKYESRARLDEDGAASVQVRKSML